jgi:hypothetical protein
VELRKVNLTPNCSMTLAAKLLPFLSVYVFSSVILNVSLAMSRCHRPSHHFHPLLKFTKQVELWCYLSLAPFDVKESLFGPPSLRLLQAEFLTLQKVHILIPL